MLAIDEKRAIVFANAAAQSFFGYSLRELLGRDVATLFLPGEADGVAKRAKHKGLAGTVRVAEPPLAAIASRKDGEHVRVEVAWSPAAAPGSGDLSVAVIRDASAHLGAMEELRTIAHRFEALVNAVTDYAIFLIDPEGQVVSWNAGAERMKGWRADEIVGRSFKLLYTSEDVARGRPEAVLQEAARSGRTEDEGWRIRKDGTRFYANVIVTTLHDAEGRVSGFAKVTRDVTARWRADVRRRFFEGVTLVLSSSLGDSESALRALAHVAVREVADFCVLDLLDTDGNLQRLEVTCGRADDGYVTELLRELPPTHPGFLSTAEVYRSGRPRVLTVIAQDEPAPGAPDGKYAELVRRMAPRSAVLGPLVARGRTLGVMALIRSHGETPYDDSDLPLVLEVGAKTGMHIDNACLYRAAQSAVAERDRVLAVVAHDLRGPLSSILLRTQLTLRTLVPATAAGEALRVALSRIGESASQMERLVRDLLDVARMQGGRLSTDIRAWAPVILIGAATDAARAQADAQRVHLSTEVGENLPAVGADRDRILQVFSNLIGNALKFTPAGGTIQLKAWADRDRVWFAVSDDGPGIPPEYLPHVFDRFWQLNRADRRGLGLGLGICKWIVDGHRGEICVESSPGRGSTFRFALPIFSPGPPPPS